MINFNLKFLKNQFTRYIDGSRNITVIHKLFRLPYIDNCGQPTAEMFFQFFISDINIWRTLN